jgi:hypothetical protein
MMVSFKIIFFWDLKVFENRMLMRIFGPNRDKIIRGWRKLHEEELNKFHSSANIIRMTLARMR